MLDVIACIKRGSPLTKQDVTRQTGLTGGTVNTFIGQLEAIGLVTESGNALSNGGRKAVLYSFQPKAYFVIGISLAVKKTTIGLLDCGLTVIDCIEFAQEMNGRGIEDTVHMIAKCVEELIRRNEIPQERLIGIGVSAPGPVDHERGVILELPHMPLWKNVPLSQLLFAETSLPVLVDNDCNCNVMALSWMTPKYSQKNLIYLATIEGMSVGILINGVSYRGSRYFAGEIGHISVNPFGEKCTCGNNGCIELYASNVGICDIASGRLQKGEASVLRELCEDGRVDIRSLIRAAKLKDQLAISVFDDAVLYVSLCIENAIKAYDPDHVVLDTIWLNEFPEYKARVIDGIFSRTKFIKRDNVQISLCDIEHLFLKGAANLVIDKDFSLENDTGLYSRLQLEAD